MYQTDTFCDDTEYGKTVPHDELKLWKHQFTSFWKERAAKYCQRLQQNQHTASVITSYEY